MADLFDCEHLGADKGGVKRTDFESIIKVDLLLQLFKNCRQL